MSELSTLFLQCDLRRKHAPHPVPGAVHLPGALSRRDRNGGRPRHCRDGGRSVSTAALNQAIYHFILAPGRLGLGGHARPRPVLSEADRLHRRHRRLGAAHRDGAGPVLPGHLFGLRRVPAAADGALRHPRRLVSSPSNATTTFMQSFIFGRRRRISASRSPSSCLAAIRHAARLCRPARRAQGARDHLRAGRDDVARFLGLCADGGGMIEVANRQWRHRRSDRRHGDRPADCAQAQPCAAGSRPRHGERGQGRSKPGAATACWACCTVPASAFQRPAAAAAPAGSAA